MSTTSDQAALTLFQGAGEVRALARAFDWSRTPLGPVSGWPQSLRSTVRTLLSSQYPMILTWGPAFTQIYNDAYSKLIGAGHPAALGHDIRITLAASWDTLGPMIERVMATGTANWTPALPLLMERAGYREEAYFSVSHAPAEDDEGRIVGMLAVCSEVTAQVVGERRLTLLRDVGAEAADIRNLETTAKDIAAALSRGFLDVPFALIYLRGDDGALSLLGSAGLDDRNAGAPRILPADAMEPWPVARVLTGRTVECRVEPMISITGGLWADSVTTALAMPISGGGGEELGVLIAGASPSRALDEGYRSFFSLLSGQVSTLVRNARAHEEERRRADALAELDRAKTRFFSNVSHEFRTPLTLMLGPLEDLLRQADLPGDARAEVQVVHRNALRLLRLVNTLLDFSRAEAGRIEAAFRATDLSRLTVDLASTFWSAIERAGLAFRVECPPLSMPAYVDHDMWEKVVLNLLSNALKYTFEGQISVRLAEVDGSIRLSVSDTGVGIPPDSQERIFDRFQRVEGARSRTHEGSGIGLALARELVMLHGGTVGVDSTIGQGTTFTVTIPQGHAHLPPEQVDAAGEPASTRIGADAFVEEALRWLPDTPAPLPANVVRLPQRSAVSQSTTQSTAKARVLVADDNADMRAYITRLLDGTHDVVAVPDGAAALEELFENGTDLLVTDVMMPVMDGFQLVQRIREEPRLRTLPIIMLSARAGEEASVEGLEAGADDYLVKPFAARELQARVRTNLELARLRREADEQAAQARKMDAIGHLTGGVAHDFNNLLAAVIGSLDLMERRVAGDERVMRLLNNAMQAAQRGARLTEQLLAFSRKQRLEVRPTDVNGVLSNMADLMHRTLGGRIGVNTLLGKDLWPAMADPNQIELAVLNLAVNARDAMPDGGQVVLQTENIAADDPQRPKMLTLSTDAVRIRVQDTGVGMSQEVLMRATEPFFTTKGPGQGTGLGLAQVYGMIKQIGGDMHIASEPGQGTTVDLYLPKTSAGVVQKAAQESSEPAMLTGKVRVLVIDDDAQVRVATAAMLTELGYDVVEGDSARSGLDRLESADTPFDLILVDYAMPGMTGGEMIAQLRRITPTLRSLLISGYAEGVPDGSGPVLRKPFTVSELGTAVARVLHAKER
ncbi:response regulator [Microvirga sp. BT688]|uniref:ATP-binding protein n=1 Tax=Microvirga sp. TaxID=1873136 RepID=UPI001685D2F8|nr:ATP-binding protein [Microvirga sp.]MBD2747098.1 response regulator [Microvirga sp.]